MSVTEVIVVFAVAAIAALVKSTTGMGYPLVLIPVLALFINIADAVVIIAPSNLYLNASLAWNVRRHRHQARTLRRFVGGGLVGAATGAVMLASLPERALRLLLVGVIVLFVLNRLLGERTDVSSGLAARLAAPVGAVAGFFQGASGISGPIVSPWFLSLGLTRDTYVFCITSVFACTGGMQMFIFGVHGTFTVKLLLLGLALIPIALVAMPVGMRLRQRLPVHMFENAVVLLLVGSAVSIVIRLI